MTIAHERRRYSAAMNRLGCIVLALLVLKSFACTARTPLTVDPPLEVAGSAMYRERILLPEGCTFRAEVVDITTRPPKVIGEHESVGGQAPPFVFSILVSRSAFNPEHAHAIRCSITDPSGEEWFTSAASPVLEGGSDAMGLQVMLISAR